ncbi:hypothetical protein VPH35_056287 [Triticum aestivum]
MTPPVLTEFDKLIPLELHRLAIKNRGDDDVVAYYQINKPSDLISSAQLKRKDWPTVCLDLESEDAPLLSIMNLKHPNILRIEAIQEMAKSDVIQKNLAVFVEPHDGPLSLFLMWLDLFEAYTMAVPSQSLRVVTRQMVYAIEELRINGFYHGDLTIHNIYYSKADGAIVVKFFNFRKRAMDLAAAQLQDWVGLGHILRAISVAATYADMHASCSIIDRLASKLELLTDTSRLPMLKEEILNDMYFWDSRIRTIFFIHEVPNLLKNEELVKWARNLTWQLPWDANPHGGLIEAMNKYREEVAIEEKYDGKDPGPEELKKHHYDGNDPIHNIQCMSGAYTHQDKLLDAIEDHERKKISVDVAVQKHQPELCLILHRLLAGEVF